ncbi:glycosyltransferase family 4 protein [Hahella sp. SMD15-11]|uniref:Glycosyltransferase family 4 protein n=1 Tax=Thermohahella caldifontis TaxID=3142973 RepID=A0AB39UT29_9GAMM
MQLAEAAQSAGYEVHVATADGPSVELIRAKGFIHHIVPFARSGQNPLKELRTLFSLVRLFRGTNPSLVHLVTIKPVLYGGIAARLAGVEAVVSAVSGLGTVFLAESLLERVRRWIVIGLYRCAFKQKKLAVIFQNPDDRQALVSLKLVSLHQTHLIRGAGVPLSDYPYIPEPEGKEIVIMAARLLRDKGVFEFVSAARLLKLRGLAVEMRLAGSPDPGNPTSVTEPMLKQWKAEGDVVLLGFRDDIAQQYAAAHIVCLPSYREGLPKSLLEAAACGRAIVTTDVPGCRDAVIPGKTGLLVPVKDVESLANAIQKLIENPGLRREMGLAGRRLAEKDFAIEKIVDQHLEIYKELLS